MSSTHLDLSHLRLHGEPCPPDLEQLVTHGLDWLTGLGVTFGFEKEWAPWADKSYLTPADLANPDIAANVKAIDDVCEYIRFVAQTDGGECIGYWVGPVPRPLSECPLVYYDTEGQFELCGSRFVESFFFLIYDEDTLVELREVCADLGIPLDFISLDDIPIPASSITPDAYHEQRYDWHLKNPAL